MSAANLAYLAGIVTALFVAAVALYRARPQKELDVATSRKIDAEIRRETAEYDRRRTRRLLRLEAYVDENIIYQREDATYHREVTDLFTELRTAGLLPAERKIPNPPTPPKPPPIPEDNK